MPPQMNSAKLVNLFDIMCTSHGIPCVAFILKNGRHYKMASKKKRQKDNSTVSNDHLPMLTAGVVANVENFDSATTQSTAPRGLVTRHCSIVKALLLSLRPTNMAASCARGRQRPFQSAFETMHVSLGEPRISSRMKYSLVSAALQ